MHLAGGACTDYHSHCAKRWLHGHHHWSHNECRVLDEDGVEAMKKLLIYLDTSVINFLFADDAPEKRDLTRRFFSEKRDQYDIVISDVVVFEISKTTDERRRRLLLDSLRSHALYVAPLTDVQLSEVEALAEAYLAEGIFPPRKREDALHVSITTVLGCDILLSWNFHHLANIRKQIRVNAVNERLGYLHRLNLLTPLEVLDEDED